MNLFRIKTIMEIESILPPDTVLSKTAKTFYRNNSNKRIFGELTQIFDKNTRAYFTGIMFYKLIKTNLNLDDISQRDLDWMEDNFIITEIERIKNTDEKGNLLFNFS